MSMVTTSAQFQYVSFDATAIAATPAWTPIVSAGFTRTLLPTAILVIQSTSVAGIFELSVDGINPIALINKQEPLKLDFRSNYRLLNGVTSIFARRVTGATVAGEVVTISFIS